MFNDILTGKASLEPRPESESPYRQQAVLPPVRHACITCGERYQAPAGSSPGRCPTCHVAMVEENTRQSEHVARASEEQARRARRTWRVLRVVLGIAVAIAIGLFKYGMRTQMREDAAQAAGYHSYAEYKQERDSVWPTDDYSYEIHRLAEEMCRCTDLRCARDLQAQYHRFVQSGAPSDDGARASVEQDGARLADCEAKLEAQ
jgi:hypothetical protein